MCLTSGVVGRRMVFLGIIIIDSLDSTNLAYKGQEHAQFVETVLLKRIINGYKAIEDIHTQICTMLSGWYGNRHHWGT